MSKENVKKFYQELASDESLRARVNDLFKEYQNQTIDKTKKAALIEELVLPIAAEKGLPFTLDELQQYETEMSKEPENGELSLDELNAVAGGMTFGFSFCLLLGMSFGAATAVCTFMGAEI